MNTTRRSFLKSSLTAPLAASLGGPAGRVLAVFTPQEGQEQFENPRIIRYDSNCFTLNDKDTFIYSAAFHYPRCPRALWRDRLAKLLHAGFNTIETYVFWNYHEPVEGRVNLSEFEEFVQLVHDSGFYLIARPGPYVCAEWDAGGFPHWVTAQQFPLRSNDPRSLETSDHWYKAVLPIIARQQITSGGPIIMVQVENEYDYRPALPEADRLAYVKGLAEMAWSGGINVPIITCWTKQARENSDIEMARVMDTCNFYPRWQITKQVVPALAKLRREEPACPLGITELQGGWFSEFGGKLSVDQDGVNAAQLNALTKTVIEQGVTYLNYYMGFGGTNFDWGGKHLTTTYDYAAPLREPGGLWDKYYAARGIGIFLNLFGNLLTRAKAAEGATTSTQVAVSVSERINGKSAVVFVRENANAAQKFKMTFRDPASPTGRPITVPREGELEIGAREMKMLAVQVPIPGGQLRYSSAELLAYGENLDRRFLIFYDEPGRLVELSLATRNEPQIEGETVYQYWDEEYESVTFGVRMEAQEKIYYFNNHTLIVFLPRQRALRSWTGDFSPKMIPESDETRLYKVPFISDIAMMAGSGMTKKGNYAEMDFAPGEHDLLLLLPPVPMKCLVDGVLTEFKYDRHWRTARLHVSTPALPAQPVTLGEVQSSVETFDPASGAWLTGPLGPLEKLGELPYGYVKYRAEFTGGAQAKMFISTFADDAKRVFINGKPVSEATNNKKQVEFALAAYAQSGSNTLEIVYELFGSPNFGENIGELKGVESVRVGADAASATPITNWQVQRFPAGMKGREVDPGFAGGTSVTLGGAASKEFLPAFTWCQAGFTLSPTPAGWSIPWKLTFEAERDALIYLNGKFVGRYETIGPQMDFYLPEPYLTFDSKRRNILTIVLAYAREANSIRTLRISPYNEYAVRRTRLEWEW